MERDVNSGKGSGTNGLFGTQPFGSALDPSRQQNAAMNSQALAHQAWQQQNAAMNSQALANQAWQQQNYTAQMSASRAPRVRECDYCGGNQSTKGRCDGCGAPI